MKLKITVPNVATVGVAGPTQCGKSIVMHRLKEVLESEFGATVVLNDQLKTDFNSSNYDSLDDWQKAMVKKTVWVLAE